MGEHETFEHGPQALPLDDHAAGESLLAACDPARAKLIDYLAFCIDRYLADALTGALSAGVPKVSRNINMRLPIDPIANVAKAEQIKLPLFWLCRKRVEFDDRTANWRQGTARLGWGYMLPAMTLEQGMKYEPVLNAVLNIVNHSLYLGFDPAYNNGERVIGDNAIAEAKCLNAVFEPYRLGDLTDTHFHAVMGELSVREQSSPSTAGLQKLTVTSLQATDQSTQEGNPADVIDAVVPSPTG